jgi:enoyl-CoA hydratase
VTHDLPTELTLTKDGAVRMLTLNRPDQLNAFSEPLHDAFIGAWQDLARDPDARAVLLTGAGRAFSVGGDINEMQSNKSRPERSPEAMRNARRLITEMVACPLPIVAAVNGPAIGLGCSVALLSDIVLMAESAFLADPHVSIGLVAGDGGAVVWPLLTSLSRAKEYLFTGDRIPAPEAERLGLANRLVADDALIPEALALTKRLADAPSFALQATKRALNLHLERAMLNVLDYTIAMELQSMETAEHHERVAVFLARQR